MFIFLMSARFNPYLASSSSSKIASSKVFEQSRPIDKLRRRATLPALRCFITGGIDDWHDMPTSAMRSSSFSRSLYASVFAEYVYREPADAMTSARVRAMPGIAFHDEPSPSRYETSAADVLT